MSTIKCESTNAEHRGGAARSSDESPKKRLEQRSCHTRSGHGGNHKSGRTAGIQAKSKPFEISKYLFVDAFNHVKANKGACGVDNVSIEEFEKVRRQELYKLWNRMSSGSYFPPPVRRKDIEKKDGGVRPLGLPTVGDKVAQAVADRLPQLKLTGKSGIDGKSLSSDNLFLSLLGEAVAPFIDWNRKKAEVEKQKAVVEERLSEYSHLFLVAIEEVENALWHEKEQKKLLLALNEQLHLAEANLAESQNRYMQGLTDYLPVLTALHTLQSLEKEIIIKSRQLISDRILLYRALGGVVLADG